MESLIVKMQFNAPVTGTMKQSLVTLVEASNAEPGCLQYQAFINAEDEQSVVFIEQWQSDAFLELHRNGTAVAEFKASVGHHIVGKHMV